MRFLLALVLIFLAACASLNAGDTCSSSAQCREGLSCITIAPAPGDSATICTLRCNRNEDCGPGGSCYCPDSPAGARCRVVEDTATPHTPTFVCAMRR